MRIGLAVTLILLCGAPSAVRSEEQVPTVPFESDYYTVPWMISAQRGQEMINTSWLVPKNKQVYEIEADTPDSSQPAVLPTELTTVEEVFPENETKQVHSELIQKGQAFNQVQQAVLETSDRSNETAPEPQAILEACKNDLPGCVDTPCLGNSPCVDDCCVGDGCTASHYLSQQFDDWEKSPGEYLIPQSWLGEVARQTYWNVIEQERYSSHTAFLASLQQCPVIESREWESERIRQKATGDPPLHQVRLRVAPSPGPLPPGYKQDSNSEKALCHVPGMSRGWCAQEKHWSASQATHAPLYFEEPNLERHGYSRGKWQPLVSGVKFFMTAPLLPGLMTIDAPTSLQYEILENSPGSVTPYVLYRAGWTYKAIAVEVATVTGLAFIIP